MSNTNAIISAVLLVVGLLMVLFTTEMLYNIGLALLIAGTVWLIVQIILGSTRDHSRHNTHTTTAV